LIALTAAAVALSLACLCLPGGVTPTPTLQPPAGRSPTPRPPDLPDEPEPGGLDGSGPWLLLETEQGLWALSWDGSSLGRLTEVDYWEWDLPQAIQPNGNMVAYLTPPGNDLHNLALNLLTVPEGNSVVMTRLTSDAAGAYADLNPGENGFEALRAIHDQPSFAWSADGTQLAFTAILQGPSADIYIFDLLTQEIRRVSQDEAQDFAPSWSPDGTHLVYLSVEGFGTGAGWSQSGVWLADTRGGTPVPISPATGTGEEILGWLDDNTVVLTTWAQPCGPQQLRLYDVSRGSEVMLEAGCINAAAVSNRMGAVLFSNAEGAFLYSLENPQPVRVAQEPNPWIERVRPGERLFTVRFELGGIFTYGTGEVDTQASPVNVDSGLLEVAEYGLIWAWTSLDPLQGGVWITGPGLEIGQIFTGPAHHPFWDLENNLIFFAPDGMGGEDIYATTFWGYFQDLTLINHIDADILEGGWIGQQP
jgi:hypothetical protein